MPRSLSLLVVCSTLLLLGCEKDMPTVPLDDSAPSSAVAGSAADLSDGCAATSPERSHLNRLEDAATPEPFGCFGLHAPGSARGNQALLNITPSDASDGIDPEHERVLLSLNGHMTRLEAGSFQARGNGPWIAEPSGGQIRRVELREDRKSGGVDLKLHTRDPDGLTGLLLVRIGDDWGGIDLDTGQRDDGTPPLDHDATASATIGAAGGSLSADGWTLRVPAGALSADAAISLTPFADGSGLRLEPDGLAFSRQAVLTGGSGGALSLRTSPLSEIPLYGGDGRAVLWHFSDVQDADGGATDYQAWADAILADAGQMTYSELQQLIGLAAHQQAFGCTAGCVDLGDLTAAITQGVAAVAGGAACQADVADPTDEAVANWLDLAADAQAAGADGQPAIDCAIRVFAALLEEARQNAVDDPSDSNLQRLFDLWGEAQAMGSPTNENLAVQAIAQALDSLLDTYSAVCELDPETGRAELERGLGWAQTFAGGAIIGDALVAEYEEALATCGGASDGYIVVNGFDENFRVGLFWIEPDGSESVHRAIHDPRIFRNFVLSPDGRRIVFHTIVQITQWQSGLTLNVMDVTGSNHIELLSHEDYPGQTLSPTFSPDGSKILFLRHEQENPYHDWCPGNVDNLWVVDVDGSGMRRMTEECWVASGTAAPPQWSPRDEIIVFGYPGWWTWEPDEDLYMVDPSSGASTRLPDTDAFHNVTLSPDGSRIAHNGGGSGFGIMDISGGGRVRVSPVGNQFAWSPDGTRLAFARPGGGIGVVDATGEGSVDITSRGINPVWSPDGSRIAFVDNHKVYTVKPDGSEETLIYGGLFRILFGTLHWPPG